MKKIKLAAFFVLCFLILDRASKSVILNSRESFSGEWVELKLFMNPKFYFFSLDQFILCFIIGAALVLLFFLLWNSWKKKDYLSVFGALLIIAGGSSNFLDRMLFGYVIDWIRVSFLPMSIFNIADIMIFLGAICLIFRLIKS